MDHVRSSLAPEFAYWLSSNVTLVSILMIVVTLTVQWYRKHHEFAQVVNNIPGPYALPVLGNALDLNCSPEEMFNKVTTWCNVFGENKPLVQVWIGQNPIVLLTSPEAVEAVLSSNKHISKSKEYRFIQPWLATGLLTSTGEKWHTRRKLLTPAFHFKILEDFVEVFNEHSVVLINKLYAAMVQAGDDGFYIDPYTTRCTLDVICDSAMGRHIDAQSHEESGYVKAIYSIGTVIQKRQTRPWLQPELLFKLTRYAAEEKRCLKILHGFTDQVIKERKIERQQRKLTEENYEPSKPDDDQGFTRKKRLAFLDLLTSASDDGRALSDADIREEVDTFMFEGHDTTAAGISWCLFLIGSDPEVQEKVYHEILEALGDDLDRPITMKDLTNLKYLECCIKEAQRLYPSVPLFGRELCEDLTIEEFKVPAGCTVALFPYALHRNASIFPDPEAFVPERFSPENCRGRHPYAYVPFSAGPRNCIGQKFALMEEKVVLAHVFRKFQVKSLDKREDISLLGELILRPKDGLRVSLTVRTTA